MKPNLFGFLKGNIVAKILLSIVLAVFIAVSVIGCGGSSDNNADDRTLLGESEQLDFTETSTLDENLPLIFEGPTISLAASLSILIDENEEVTVVSESNSDFVYDLGETIIINVTSSLDAEMFIRGYGKSFPITPRSGTIYELIVDMAGEFLIEVGNGRLEIVTITVQ